METLLIKYPLKSIYLQTLDEQLSKLMIVLKKNIKV